MGRFGISCRATLLAVLLAPVAGPTLAQSGICARLEARLTALDSGAGNFGRNLALENQIRDQSEELDQATADATAAGCTAFFQLRQKPGCGTLMETIKRLRANLDRLTTARDRSDDRFGAGAERRELVQALAANRCGSRYENYAQPGRRSGFIASLFGRRLFRDRGWGGGLFPDATYRTLCVRTCDGYYFPISFTTVPSRFARDEQLCQSMCPGTNVSLYVHRNPGEESEAMVSLSGEPYVALPTAFRYRHEYDSSCRCGQIVAATAPAGESIGFIPANDDPWGFARGAETAESINGESPVPLSRPVVGEDPETLANRAGNLVPAPVEPPASTVAGLTADGRRHIRIVGPSYFDGQ